MVWVEFTAIVLRTGRALERTLEASLFQIEAIDLFACTDKIEITRRVVVVKVAAIFWYSDLVVFAVLGMKFHVAVIVQKDELNLTEREIGSSYRQSIHCVNGLVTRL